MKDQIDFINIHEINSEAAMKCSHCMDEQRGPWQGQVREHLPAVTHDGERKEAFAPLHVQYSMQPQTDTQSPNFSTATGVKLGLPAQPPAAPCSTGTVLTSVPRGRRWSR